MAVTLARASLPSCLTRLLASMGKYKKIFRNCFISVYLQELLVESLTNEVRKTANEYHGVANNLWTLNVKNLRGFVAKDCEIQSWIEAEYLFRK